MEIELVTQTGKDHTTSDQEHATDSALQSEDEVRLEKNETSQEGNQENEEVSTTDTEELNPLSPESKQTPKESRKSSFTKRISAPGSQSKDSSPKPLSKQAGHVNLAFAHEESIPETHRDLVQNASNKSQDNTKSNLPKAVNVSEKENNAAKEKQVSNEEKKELTQEEAEGEHHERGGWGNQLDFLFSCISVSVGLGNIWRFPYLCFRNGGGSFLFTYFIAMIFCGIPVFFQEVAIGQYLGVGGMTLIAQLAPIMKGVGFATMTVVFLINVYYCVIIAWTMFYLIASFTALPGLPWQTCDGWWNSANCFIPTENMTGLSNGSVSAVEEFWSRRVLGVTDGIENIGGMRWELFGTLILSYVLVYFIIWEGIHQGGYIIWFTALFPYVILSVLLVRAVTLEGAGQGLLYYITPDWDLLLTSGPWIDGATQIFFAYSIGTGALPALGSYNKFKYNCYRDAIITCIVNTMTCLIAGVVTFAILGHIAHVSNSSIESVVSSGPGLVFITYPEVVLRLPGSAIWAMLFFVMLAILGIDSAFCNVEAFITGVVDNWPGKLRRYRKAFVTAAVVLLFLLGLPMVTEGGVYLFQIMDYYSASGMSMLFLVFFQTIAIGWIFGGRKFCDCVEEMLGTRPSWFFYICWVYLAPGVMFGIFVFYVIKYTPVTYSNDYTYPKWAEMLGICISLSSMLWIPLYAVYYIMTTPGTLKEVLLKGVTPIYKSRSTDEPTPVTEKDVEKLNNGACSSRAKSASVGPGGTIGESTATLLTTVDEKQKA